MKKNLIWLRNDLRIRDNTALHEACKSDIDEVIALFIDTPEEWKKYSISKKKISFMYHNLMFLQQELSKLNIVLHYHESINFFQSIEYLMYFCSKNRITNLFYNYQYEINERHRDCLVKKKLSQQGVCVQGFHDSILVLPKYTKNKKNETYKIFSFFKKKIISHIYNHMPKCFSMPLKRKINKDYFLRSILFKKLHSNFNKKLFPIGESEAINRLKSFFLYKINDYSTKKDFPFLDSTSILSPYLSLGILSPRHCFEMLLKMQKCTSLNNFFNSSWLNQILWREFYYHILISFPSISKHESLVAWEKKIRWSDNMKYFNAWKEGNTGFPIVDAGMRQLNKLGWMHNRLRMITSSFLVKNLLINWRIGEKYFISQLIDGDLALNNGGWQWSASVGSDYTPYIRIFSPLNQSKKFDESGFFIKKFIPELRKVPNQHIHEPHEWSQKTNYKIDYPNPIINYNDTRKKALLIFNKARSFYKKGFNFDE